MIEVTAPMEGVAALPQWEFHWRRASAIGIERRVVGHAET